MRGRRSTRQAPADDAGGARAGLRGALHRRGLATGSGGTATTTRPSTISSSTTCSAGTSATSTERSTSRSLRSSSSPTSPPSRRETVTHAPTGFVRRRRWTARSPATSSGSAPASSRFSAAGARCTRWRRVRRPVVTGVRFGFDRDHLYRARRPRPARPGRPGRQGGGPVTFFDPAAIRVSRRARPALSTVACSTVKRRATGSQRLGRGPPAPPPHPRARRSVCRPRRRGRRAAELLVGLSADGHALEQYPPHHPLDLIGARRRFRGPALVGLTGLQLDFGLRPPTGRPFDLHEFLAASCTRLNRHPQTFHRARSWGIPTESDNKCYVN